MIHTLHKKLSDAYTDLNLNRITAKLITAYRTKNRAFLLQLSENIRDIVPVRDGGMNRIFTSLVQLYHPDRLQFIRNDLDRYFLDNNLDQLNRYSHIFLTLDFLAGYGKRIPEKTSIDYSAEFEYGYDRSDFDQVIENQDLFYTAKTEASGDREDLPFIDFIQIISEHEGIKFGVGISLDALENLTGELILTGNRIHDLNGIKYCSNITCLNLSANELIDIIQLGFLTSLEELYLSENQIDTIDGLSALTNLKILDLSFNAISDIRPIIDLPALEYVNLIGNPVDAGQIKLLQSEGVLVLR